MERLGAMYHWSPKENRRDILRNGLQVMEDSGRGCAFPWICLAPTPAAAWGYLPQGLRRSEHGLDLWQVRPAEFTRAQIVMTEGPDIHEVWFFETIPPDRIWWVGERLWQPHDTMLKPPGRRVAEHAAERGPREAEDE